MKHIKKNWSYQDLICCQDYFVSEMLIIYISKPRQLVIVVHVNPVYF